MMRNMNERLRGTVLYQTVERVGIREASKVMAYIVAWGSVHMDLGHEPTTEEYCAWWKVSASTGYRELRSFREAWPEFANPTEMLLACGVDLERAEVVPTPATLRVPQGGFA